MLSIIIENPTGVGFGNIKYIMEAKTGLFINSHNTPFGIAMDYGIFTLFFLLITIIQAFRYYAKGIILASNKEKRMLISALFSSLGAMIFHGLFHEIYIHFMLWFFVAIAPVAFRSLKFT